jgi:hypothetical protein
MDAFISRGMVGQGSTTKDWFKSTDRFEQEIGAKVNRQDRQLTFADCFKSAGCTTDSDSPSHSFFTETALQFLSLVPSALRRTRRALPFRIPAELLRFMAREGLR